MNRIVWYGKEVDLKSMFDTECAETAARRYVVTGAVPSLGEFIPQRDLVVDDMPDRVPERVNVPSHMWTMACCDKSRVEGGKSFFMGHVVENRAGGEMEEFNNVGNLTRRISQLYNYTVEILADDCSGVKNDDLFG